VSDEALLTTQEVALALGITAASVRHLAALGAITPVEPGGNREGVRGIQPARYTPDVLDIIAARLDKPVRNYPQRWGTSAAARLGGLATAAGRPDGAS
jgi:hypothetical protein